MRKRNMIALATLFLFYVLFGVFLVCFQESIVYYPNSQDFNSCASFQDAEKVEHNGTRMYVKDIYKPTVVLYHGNAGSACDRSLYANIFTQEGYGYIIVEYAGYSNDSQEPSHEAIKRNVQDVVAYIQESNITNITVIGESIGTGVASYHTSLLPPDKLLLISPFTNLVDVAKKHYWFYPTSILVTNAYDNTILLSTYRNPVTIIHGDMDTIISHELGQKLFSSLDTQKEFVTIEDAGHNDLFSHQQTHTAVVDFLK